MAKTVHARTLSVQSIDYKYGKVIIPPYEVDIEFTPLEEAALDSGINANMIPSTAGANNKLADRLYVDNAVSEYSAHFLGTSALNLTEEQFLAWANTLDADNNDYCYWWTVDSDSKTIYKRYKYSGTDWLFEYNIADPSSVPTALSQLADDANHRLVTDTEKSTWSGKEDKSNKVTSWQVTPDNTHYPSEKLVKDSIDGVDNVYIADSSTYDRLAVTAALNAGKMVFLKYNNSIWAYKYSDANDSHHFFGWYTNGGAQGLRDVYNNGGTNTVHSLSRSVQSYLIKTTIAGNESSDTYYPTTKAVADYAEKKTDIVAPVNDTDATLPITALTCEVGKYYRIDVAVDTLAVTLPAMTDLTTVRTVVIYLTAGSTTALTIASADSKDVYYQDGFEIEANNTYEINALFNGAAWIVAAVKINTSNS